MGIKRILSRLLLIYVAFAAGALILVTIIVKPLLIRSYSKSEAKSLYENAASFSQANCLLYYAESMDQKRLLTNMRAYSGYLHADMWLMNEDGIIACAVNASSFNLPKKFNPTDVIKYFDDNYYNTGTFYDYYDASFISVIVPINVRYKTCGYLIMSESIASIEESAYKYMDVIYEVLIITLAIGFVGLCIIAFIFLRPINAMLTAAKEYSSGNYKPQIPLYGNDELSYLITTYNFMAERLDTHEDEQRKFISNVSHDFRSPLTSIRGYLQAMLDGTIPPEMYEKYLTRILNEADRLTNLTNSLLDLNRIGSRDFVLDMSDFDINDIIIACAESSEVQSLKKNVHISLLLTSEVLKVHADKEKIQQVIYNLLDNAIKFSKPDTTITIETRIYGSKKVHVSIKDQGIGIPEDSIDKLFNRFYKTDLSRGQDKKGTGLGLSIVKEIIQAHNEKITVTSTIDVGTTFTFSLKLADEELAKY